MKIAWQTAPSQLGLNGGSRTTYLSALTMAKLGHEVYLVGDPSKYTWHKIELPVLKKIPDNMDLLIATSAKSIPSVAEAKAGIKCIYVRGWEVWANSEKRLKYLFSLIPIKICNSSWLQKQIPGSYLVHQGVDFQDWPNLNQRKLYDKTTIGCLYNIRHPTKKWKNFIKLQKLLGTKEFNYIAFGIYSPPQNMRLNTYLKNPIHNQLVKLYNKADYWLCPSTLEGLCNIGLESGLTGCNLIGSNAKKSSLQDYIIDKKTGYLYNKLEDVLHRFKAPYDSEMNKRLVKLIHEKIGSREDAMRKFIEVCCKIQ